VQQKLYCVLAFWFFFAKKKEQAELEKYQGIICARYFAVREETNRSDV